MALETTPVCVLVAVTVTPGMKARVASWTNPPTDALLVCANKLFAETRQTSTLAAINSFRM
jgi:hypothetical protein